MAHSNVAVTTTAAAQLTTSVSAARVHNLGQVDVILQATATSTPPTDRAGGIKLAAGQTLAADLPLAELFPGIGAGAMFLWAFADVATTLAVSHA